MSIDDVTRKANHKTEQKVKIENFAAIQRQHNAIDSVTRDYR